MTLDMFKEIIAVFSSTASTVVIAIIAALAIYGFKVLCNRFGLTISSDNMTEIIAIVTQVIKYLDQKFVDTIKKNSPSGTLTDYQKSIIKDKSIEMVKAILNSKQIEFLLEKYKMEEIDDVLDILIESTIKDTRVSDNTEAIIISDISNEETNIQEIVAETSYQPTDVEYESILICPGNCAACTLSEECTICRK